MVCLKTGLINEEFTSYFQGIERVVQDFVAQPIAQPEERYTREDVIGLGFSAFPEGIEHVGGAVIDYGNARVLNGFLKDRAEVCVQFDENQAGIRLHFLQEVVGKDTGAGSIFDDEVALVKIDFAANLSNADRRGRGYGCNVSITYEGFYVSECLVHLTLLIRIPQKHWQRFTPL